MEAYLDDANVVDSLIEIAGPDFALSLGYRFYFLSNSPLLKGRSACDTEILCSYYKVGKRGIPAGSHCVWHNRKMIVIAVDGQSISVTRFIEVVVHEVSHCVDSIFERCAIKNVDTELRAYYNDWLVGKILHLTSIDFLQNLGCANNPNEDGNDNGS